MEGLRSTLKRIDGKGYKAYKELEGRYDFGDFMLTVDHVQGDPFAQPSRISIYVASGTAALPEEFRSSDVRKTALEDCLARSLAASIRKAVKGRRGTGKSGQVRIETSGQQILRRNALIIDSGSDSGSVDARITIGLPADGRRILAKEAEAIFFDELPRAVRNGLFFRNLSSEQIKKHVEASEDQTFLRGWLAKKGLMAFVADDSLLPRMSGVDDRPLGKGAIPFRSPDSLSETVDLPNSGPVRGMAIPCGVTLIVGGGFHGKSTLLHALERGVYNHIPGDGRERVVTLPTAVKIRAEDGRIVSDVDISPFIDNLPLGRDTRNFSTENASGSTSQAANIMEALECDTKLLLIDEDTSATNFMIRDERMQALVARDKEPITPLLHRVRELYEEKGVSSIIVMGGSGDYFDVSDNVIMMDCYEPIEVTERAKSLARAVSAEKSATRLPPFGPERKRRPDIGRLSPARGNRDVKIDNRDIKTILYGEHLIDLTKVEQLVDMGQTRAIGLIIYYYAIKYASSKNIVEGLKCVFRDIEEKGLDILSPYKEGELALPRIFEVAAAINRIRPKG